MAYPLLPNITTTHPLLDVMAYPNIVTNYLFYPLILMASFVILTVWFSGYGRMQNSIMASSFITMILSIVFRSLNLVGDLVMFVFIAIAGLSFLWVELTREEK